MTDFCSFEQIMCKYKNSYCCPRTTVDHAPHYPQCKKIAEQIFQKDANHVVKLKRLQEEEEQNFSIDNHKKL